jgi:hypothetical protein
MKPLDASTPKSSTIRIWNLVAAGMMLAMLAFVIDLAFPPGVAICMVYIGCVLLTLWLPRRASTVMAAAAGSVLTIIGAAIPPAGGIQWMMVVNRALAIAILWITAALVLLHKQASEDINLLRRWLPVCASCKKIRDDQGFWQGLEEFVEQHSDVLFTHSLCPVCTNKWSSEMYPQLAVRHPDRYPDS